MNEIKKGRDALRLEISLDGRFAWLFQGQDLIYTLSYKNSRGVFEITASEEEYEKLLTDEEIHDYFNLVLEMLSAYREEATKLLKYRDLIETELSGLIKIKL